MYTLTTLAPLQYDDIAAGETRLKVPFEIKDSLGNTVFEQNQSFPLGASADEIKESLARALQTYTDDAARYETTKVDQAARDNASAVAAEIANLSINA